jgi:quinoprotein glucose dehydrogenase
VSVYTGVYSADQADRGNAIQRRACATCHSSSDWSAGRILGSWTGQTAFDLVSHIRNTMPLTAPGSLSLQEYTDIVAYMFELNDIPAGEQELAADDAALRNVRLEYRR